MSEKDKKELIIIGAGPGGYAAAFRAADLGLEVTMIDPEVNPGGVCLYRGCIPSKALLHLAKVKKEAMEAPDMGISFNKPEIEPEKIRTWKDKVVKKLTNGIGELSKARKIEYIQGRASFISEDTLEIAEIEKESYELRFKNAIVATGSRNINLPNIKVDHERIIDSTDALELNEIPETMLVIGGGYIGLEMGSVYAAFGSNVSVAEMTRGFLPGADRDLVKVFEKEHPFKEVWFETKVVKATVQDKKVQVTLENEEGKQEKEFDLVLVAVGRKPNSDKGGLDKAKIELDEKGYVKTDGERRTSNKNIFAIGDLTGEPLLAHKASYEGKIAAEVLAGKAGAGYDPRSIPGIVFTDPEIAWCGLTETTAKEQGMEVELLKFPWKASGRAAAIGVENGFTKLLVDPESGIILGGGVAGRNAGSLITQISVAIEMGATAKDLALCIHPHPTLSETIMETAELFSGGATHFMG